MNGYFINIVLRNNVVKLTTWRLNIRIIIRKNASGKTLRNDQLVFQLTKTVLMTLFSVKKTTKRRLFVAFFTEDTTSRSSGRVSAALSILMMYHRMDNYSAVAKHTAHYPTLTFIITSIIFVLGCFYQQNFNIKHHLS